MNPRTVSRPDASGPGLATVATALRGLGFWCSIALPLAYLPLLVLGVSGRTLSLFVGLLAVHAACLLLGHGYER